MFPKSEKMRKKALLADLALFSRPSSLSSFWPKEYDYVVLWDGSQADVSRAYHSRDVQFIALADLIAENSQDIHNLYLDWVAIASDCSKRGGISSVKHLLVGEGVSLWWGSLIVEKCNFLKTPSINSALKLIALEKYFPFNLIEQLDVAIDQPCLALQLCISDICKMHQCACHFDVAFSVKKEIAVMALSLRFKLLFICSSLKGTAWLLKAYLRSFLCKMLSQKRAYELSRLNHETTFLTYTAQMSKSTYSGYGLESSAYWGSLPGALSESRLGANWVYIFASDPGLRSLRKAVEHIHLLDKNSGSMQSHLVLDSLFSVAMCMRSILQLSHLFIKSISLSQYVLPRFQGVHLGYLFLADFASSYAGITAAKNLFMYELFNKLFSELPCRDKLIYLQEGMDWEYMMLQVARVKHFREIIGFPHTTISFWDMRYSLAYSSVHGKNTLPLPDLFALSGDLCKQNFLKKNPQLTNKTVDVEALRYLKPLTKPSSNKAASDPNHSTICLLGTISKSETEELMLRLSQAIERIDNSYNISIAIKFHPLLDLTEFAVGMLGNRIQITSWSVEEILSVADIVLCGERTSACIDALLAGHRPIIYCSEPSLIINPLYGSRFAEFVASVDELIAVVISRIESSPETFASSEVDRLLNRDPSLALWLRLVRG